MGQVQLDDVTKEYKDVVAVDKMDFTIQDGEFVSLVGPSGCGKSTTLEMIAGLTNSSKGRIFINDRDVTDLPPKEREIAMVFQNIALFPHMDVHDNISFGLRLHNYSKDEIDRRVKDAAEVVQLQGMLHRDPDELSGGQRQRVAIARAIVREPEVFLMDEPLANLDAKLRIHMRTQLQRLHKELDTTIIYVTHDQAEAMTMSDRIAIIKDGKLQQIDPPLDCYNAPENEFVAGFIGSPSMNQISSQISEATIITDYFNEQINQNALNLNLDSEFTVGVRPEDIYMADSNDIPSNSTDQFSMIADVLEPMGDEIFVYLRQPHEEPSGMGTDADQLLMSVAPDSDVSENELVDVVLDCSRMHLFDAGGKSLLHGLPAPKQEVEQ